MPRTMIKKNDDALVTTAQKIYKTWSSNHVDQLGGWNSDFMDSLVREIFRIVRCEYFLPDGTHLYWSTHCRHDGHEACGATELAPGLSRQPAQCKTCAAPCTCDCHRDTLLPPTVTSDSVIKEQ